MLGSNISIANLINLQYPHYLLRRNLPEMDLAVARARTQNTAIRRKTQINYCMICFYVSTKCMTFRLDLPCNCIEKKNNQPRPEAVVLGRPPEGAVYVRLPPLGAWSWSGPGFSQAPTEASPLMTNSRLIQCHARVLPNPDQNGKSTPDRSKLFGSHGQRPWF